MLNRFKINIKRDLLVPDFECYQMDLSGPVQAAIESGQVSDDFRELPSWSKFAAHPEKSRGFFVRVLEALFLGKGGFDELNVKLQTEDYSGKPRVAMMFVNAKNNHGQLDMIDNIINETLPAWKVITLAGSRRYNGKKITNKNSQAIVSEIVEEAQEEGKSVLIISSDLAQRSFSIPEITELYLAYDAGQMGATIQKMSRALTPGEAGKTGRIFSLSFDPNRDDKFDAMVLETAINIKKRKGLTSTAEALRTVLGTVDFYLCGKDGAVVIDKDQYLTAALARKAVSRVLGKTINLSHCSTTILEGIASGNVNILRGETQDRVQTGKTRESNKKQASNNKPADQSYAKLMARAREVVVTILENMDVIIYGTASSTLAEAIEKVYSNQDFQSAVEEEFGVGVDLIQYLFENDILRQEHVELLHDFA